MAIPLQRGLPAHLAPSSEGLPTPHKAPSSEGLPTPHKAPSSEGLPAPHTRLPLQRELSGEA